MNKSYRTIWNDALEAWVAVSEIDTVKGKSASSCQEAVSSKRRIFSVKLLVLSLTMALGAGVSVYANAADGTLQCTWVGHSAGVGPNGQPSNGGHSILCGNGAAANPNQSLAIGPLSSALGAQSIAIGGDAKATGNNSVAIGGDDLSAVAGGNANNSPTARKYNELTGDSLFKGYTPTTSQNGAVAVGVSATAGQLATAFGTRTVASGIAAVALGVGSTASKENAVAIGAGSTTETNASAPQSVTINGVTFRFQGGSNLEGGDQVSFGSTGFERQLKHVAPGVVSDSSTDAINGSQLYSVASELVRVGKSVNVLEDTKVHFYSVNNATTTAGNYNNGGATGDNALAAGVAATAAGMNAIAVGNSASAGTASSTVAIGDQANIGKTGDSTGAIAIGLNSVSDGKAAVAIGSGTKATQNHTLALGVRAQSTAQGSVAIGQNSSAAGENAIAIGSLSKASANVASAFGAGANAAGAVSTAIGNDALASANATAVGHAAKATGTSSTALGEGANASDGTSTALGVSSVASGAGSLAAGASANASGWRGTAVGISSIASGGQAVALGDTSKAAGSKAIAVGNNAKANVGQSIVIGNSSEVNGTNAGTLGNNNTVAQVNTFVIGNGVTTSQANSVVLGNASSDRAATTVNSATVGGLTYSGFAGQGAVNNGVISVGSTGKERQLINVAAGEISATSTDAINGSQLYSVANQLQNRLTHYYSVNDSGVQGDNYNNDGATGIHSIASGKNAKSTVEDGIAIGYQAQANSDVVTVAGAPADAYVGSVAIGRNAHTSGKSAVALGLNTEAYGRGAVAIGDYADAKSGQAVAIGAGSVSTGAGSIAMGSVANASKDLSIALGSSSQATIARGVALGSASVANRGVLTGVSTNAAAVANSMQVYANETASTTDKSAITETVKGNTAAVSVGNATNTRQITNVAAGSENSDAVNVAQLKAVANSIQNTHYYSVNDNGIVGGNYNNDGATGLNAMAAGIGAAASGERATAFGSDAAASGENSTVVGYKAAASGRHSVAFGYASGAAGDYSLVLGDEASASQTNTIAVGSHANASSEYAQAIGINAVASGVSSVALGNTAKAAASEAVALGHLSNASAANTTAIGYGAATAGEQSTALGANSKAVNFKDVALGSESVSEAAVGTSSATVNGINYGGFAGNSPTANVSVGSNTVKRTVTNVAAGRIDANSTDAINGSQLYQTQNAIGNVASSAKNILGGNAALDSSGNLSMSNIGGTNQDTVDEAIKHVNKGWKAAVTATSNGEASPLVESDQIQPDETLTFEADKNIKLTQAAGTITVATKDDVSFNSVNSTTVTAGSGENRVELGNDGVKVGGNTYINNGGLNANDKKITNVADGAISATSTDAVNGKQLFEVQNGGWNLKGNGSQKDLVKQNDAVDFVNGTGTTAAVETAADGVSSTVKFSVNKSTLNVGSDGNVAAGASGDNFATAEDVATAINSAAKSTVVEAGNNTSVNSSVNGKTTTYTVNAEKTTVSGTGDVKVTAGTKDAKDVTDYAVDLTDEAKAKIEKGSQAKDKVDTEGLTFAADNNTKTDVKKLGESLSVTGDSNITTAATADGIQVKLNPDLNVTSVTAGDSKLVSDGLTISNGAANNPVSLTKNGLDNGGNIIKNVASGGDTDTNAANIADVKAAASKLASEGFKVNADQGGVQTHQLGKELAIVAGNSSDAASSDNLLTSIEQDATTGKTTVTLKMKDAPTFKGKVNASSFQAGNNVLDDTAMNVGGQAYTNVSQAVNALDTAVQQPITFGGDSGNEFARKLGTQVNVKGGAEAAKLSDNNIGVVSNGTDTLNVKLSKELTDLTSAQFKDASGNTTTVSGNGVNITPANGQTSVSLTSSGLDNGGNKIANVADGENPKDAVNKSQLDAVKTLAETGWKVQANDTEAEKVGLGDTVKFTDGTNIKITQNGKNLTVATTDTLKADSFTVNGNGPVLSGSGLNNAGNKITGVADGTVEANSKDAVNGGQLNAQGEGVKNIIGGDTVYNPVDGSFTNNNIGGTGKSTIDEAIKAANATANAGWNLTAQGENKSNVAPNDTVDLNNTDKNIVISKTTDSDNVTFNLAKDLNVDSITAGDSKLNTDGLTISNGAAGNPVKLTKSGLDNGGNKITNVAAGTVAADSTDAVNGSQLFNTADSIKTVLGGNATVTPEGKVTTSNIGGTGANTVEEAVAHLNKGWKAAITATADGEQVTPISGGDQIQPDETLTYEAGKNIKLTQEAGKIAIATKDDVNFNSVTSATVTAGSGDNQVVLGNEGVKVGGNTYISANGLNANDKVISNVAAGKTDKDAVNVSQLTPLAKALGTQVDPASGTISAPTFVVTKADGSKYDGANTIQGALDNIGTEIQKPITFGGDSGNEFTRKLGTKVNVKGGADETKLSDNNIGVVSDGTDTLNVKLAKELTDLTSAQFKDAAGHTTTVNGAGITIENGAAGQPVSLTTNGLDNGGNKVTNVADGAADTDAVNKRQLDAATASARNKVAAGKNIEVAEQKNNDGSTTYTVATKDEVQFTKATLGDTVIDGTTGDITGLKNKTLGGNDFAAAGRAATEEQLNAAQSNLANILGGNATNTGGNVSVSDIGGTGKSTIDEAIRAANTTANAGWNLTAQGKNSSNVAPNDTVDLNNTDNNIVISKTADSDNVTFNLAKDLKVDSITAGSGDNQVVLGNDGVTVGGNTYINGNGLNANDKVISNVAAGKDGKDAVNVSQLTPLAKALGAQVDPTTGTISAPTFVVTKADGSKYDGADTIQGALDNIGTEIQKPITFAGNSGNTTKKLGETLIIQGSLSESATASDRNIRTKVDNGVMKIELAESPKFGDVTINDNGKITGVADGEAPTDAVNKRQLDAAAAAARNKVAAGNNIEVTENQNADGSTTYTVATAKKVGFDSVKAGQGANQVTLDDAGVSIGGNTYISDAGLNANNKKVSNVADGNIASGSKDAVNGGQLHNTATSIANVFGGNAQVNPDGSINMSNVGGTGANNVNDAIQAVNQAAVQAKTTVTAGDNIVVTQNKNADGSNNYTVATAKDLKVDSVVAGDTTLNGKGLTIANGPSITSDGVDAGGKKLTNVAAGEVSANSKDAINGSQLHQVYQLLGGNGSNINTIDAPSNTDANGNTTPAGTVVTVVTNPDGSKTTTTETNQKIAVSTDKGGNQYTLTTYNVEGQNTYVTNDVIQAIGKMNEQGIKFFHTNDGNVKPVVQGHNTQDSSASGAYATAIGYQTSASGNGAVAMGNTYTTTDASGKTVTQRTQASGQNSIAIGSGAQALETNTIAIGTGNVVSGKNSGAIGDPNTISGSGSYALGNDNTVSTNNTFVVGNNVTQTLANSVILGNQSAAIAVHTTAGGGNYTYAGANDANVSGVKDVVGVVSVGAEGKTRQVQNVAAGVVAPTSTDAINGSQLYYTNEAINKIGNYTANLGNQLNQKIDDVGQRANAGTASAMAMAGLPQAYLPGKSMMAVSGSTYRGESGYAVGYSSISDNGNWIIKGTAGGNSRGHFGATAGVGYQW